MKELLKTFVEKYKIESLALLSPDIDGLHDEGKCLGRIEMLAEIIRFIEKRIKNG